MEQPQINPSEPKRFPIKDMNLIQVNLIKDSGEDPMAWVLKNSAAVDKIIELNPNLIGEYKKNPKEVENFIKGLLEEKEELSH